MKYQNNLLDRIECEICPRKCKLKEGQRGFCYVRRNINSEIILETYGYNTGLAIDPIEKKPLYHFLPHSKVLSFGTFGCCMGCLFCQNYHITKVKGNIKTCQKANPLEIVEIAKKYNCQSVAFTYNDPIVFFEYAVDCAKMCQKEGIKTVAVTSGYINSEARSEFFKYINATNIDLKGFSEEFYSKNCLAHLEPVLDTIKYVALETSCHLELTTLLIENENTSNEMLEKQCDWIVKNIGKDIPLHFSRFFPKYKFLNYPVTSIETMIKAKEIAKKFGINYVYLGNV